MKIRVNQLSVALYDNKPTLPANRWFEPNPQKEDYTNRFKLEMNFLGDFAPVKLRCSLIWGPSQLRRYDHWKRNSELYETWVQRAYDIQAEARAGRIKTSIPALIAIPNQNKAFDNGRGKKFSWEVPVIPSLVIAVQEQSDAERFWNITWISALEERIFVLNATDTAVEVENKKTAPTSNRISATYKHPGEFESGLFMETIKAKQGAKVDEDYQNFKRQVMDLIAANTTLAKMQVNHMCSQHRDWEERLIKGE